MRCAVLLMFLSMACDQVTNPGRDGAASDLSAADAAGGATDAAGTTDAAAVGDLAGRPECQDVRECALLPRPTAVRACQTPNWSCVAGRCTLECNGSRTCYLDNQGCLSCNGQPRECPGSACFGPALASGRVEDVTCQRPFLTEIDACFGGFVRLRDGMICSVRDLPTGAIREVLACGGCQTQLVF